MNNVDIGHQVGVEIALPSQAATNSSAITGTGIDRTDYDSVALVVNVGAGVGSSGSFSIEVVIQDSASLSTGYNAHSHKEDGSTTMTTGAITASGLYVFPFNIRHLNKYIRAYTLPSVTTWTNIPISAEFVLGGGRNLPITN